MAMSAARSIQFVRTIKKGNVAVHISSGKVVLIKTVNRPDRPCKQDPQPEPPSSRSRRT